MSVVLRRAILAAADAVEAAREALCELDASTGDGDHGVTMTIGARNVRQRLENVGDDDLPGMVRAAAIGMSGVGGAIGPLYAAALLAAAAELQAGVARAEEGTRVEDRVAVIADCAAAALGAVTRLGGAKPGDKTIVDALAPVVSALRSAASDGQTLAAALEAARTAARHGAESTVGMAAAVGRSSRFGERSVGSADPGASSLALIVEALVTSVLEASEPADAREVG